MARTGEKPGKGYYTCLTCGQLIILDDTTDTMPPCPTCNGVEFERGTKFKRDMGLLGAVRPQGRPKWKGPVPSKYYYRTKNKKHPKMAAWIVLFTDDPQYEKHINQIVCVKDGYWSLIESDIPLPVGPGCKLCSHGKVEEIKDKLFKSHDRASHIRDSKGERLVILGEEVTEEEVFT